MQPPPPTTEFVAHQLDMLVNVSGSRGKPVVGFEIRNITFTGTVQTLLDGRWTTPSGGDWALNKNGAVFVEGSEGFVIDGCTFTRLDNTAVRTPLHLLCVSFLFEI